MHVILFSMTDTNKLEAIIFSEGGELPVKKITQVLEVSIGQLSELVQTYNAVGRGTVLVQDDKKVLMRVSGEYAEIISNLRKETLNEELSKPALETLAIVLYRGGTGTSTSEVEQVRGVNSGYTLRQLTMRGLLSKYKAGMSYRYTPTAELLSHLGVTSSRDLPNIVDIQKKIKEFEEIKEEPI